MHKKYESKTGLFLIELIIVILFFSLTSAICIQLFVKSHILSKKTTNSNHAMLWVQNITEVFYSENGNFDSIKEFFPTTESTNFTGVIPEFISSYDDAFAIQFNSNWEPINSIANRKYTLLALYSDKTDFHTLDLCVYECPNSPIDILSYKTFIDDLDEKDIWNYHIQIVKYKQKGA